MSETGAAPIRQLISGRVMGSRFCFCSISLSSCRVFWLIVKSTEKSTQVLLYYYYMLLISNLPNDLISIETSNVRTF